MHERPQAANQRLEIGHWEGDLMHFGRKTQTNLITLRERYSRFMMAIKNPDRKAKGTASRIIKALTLFKDNKVKSLTFDNGFEFAHHEGIAKKLKLTTYFCDPYKSYQKGSIENGNKQLREWFCSHAADESMTQQKVNYRIHLINRRPMKCLDYKTPTEVFKSDSSCSDC